jgi:hypothetical protein
MAWAKFSDDTHHDIAHLSHPAARLFYTAITHCRERKLGGRLEPNELLTLGREQGIANPTKYADEICQPRTTGDEPYWIKDGDSYVIRQYEKHNPLTSAERTRKWRHRDAGVTQGVTSQVASRRRTTAVTPRIRAGDAEARTGSPEPESRTRVVSSDTTTPKPPEGAVQLVEVWNANCGDLPKVRGVPKSGELRRAIDRTLEYFGSDFGAIASAVQRCAGDQHYRENRFGLVAFARHMDRWDEPSGAGVMSNVIRAQADAAQRWLDGEGVETPVPALEGPR